MSEKPTNDITAYDPLDPGSTRQPDHRETVACWKGNPAAGPFADYEDFLARGQMIGSIELLGYLHHVDLIVWLDAGAPDYERPTIQAFIDAITKLPDLSLLYRVVVANHEHELDPWIKQISGGSIAAETDKVGTTWLYRPTAERLDETLAYEWGLRFIEFYEDVQKRLQMAWDVEPFPLRNAFGRDNPKLRWARLIQELLSPALGTIESLEGKLRANIFELILAVPIHSAILGRAISACLNDVRPKYTSSHHVQHVDLAAFVMHAATPFALERLKKSASPAYAKLIEWLEAPVDRWLLEWPVD